MTAQPMDTVIVGHGGTEVTCEDLDRQTRRIAARLDEQGLTDGDRIAV